MTTHTLQQAIETHLGTDMKRMASVSGGSINKAAKVTTADGKLFFIKSNAAAPDDMFPKEVQGLKLLRDAGSGLRIPDVVGHGVIPDGTAFLIMEYIEEGAAGSQSAQTLGKQLAALHQHTTDTYGLDHDNYIGKLPQSNRRHDEWIDFFIEERLQPQLQQAVDAGKLTSRTNSQFERLYNQLPELLAGEPPSLLHGDLWGGNYFFDTNGQPVIYDPAVYYGNREIELAFTHLFGGFPAAFYNAYEAAYPLQPGFNERKDIYNLYPLLVHVNLFGGSYARQVETTVSRF